MYTLIFSQHFDREKGQDYGRLLLKWIDPKVARKSRDIEIWVATSSHRNLQDQEDFHHKGGLIPPTYRCDAQTWVVHTKPIPMPHVRGVEGNFYKIDPHIVKTDKGGVRGDFGIHLDANVEGSLGCIVMNKRRFEQFERQMRKLREHGIKEIPLVVIYS